MSPLFFIVGPLLSLALIQIKHLIVDFVWQPPYEWQNKGTFLHFGGIRHAGKNAIGTALCIYAGFFFAHSIAAIALICVLDFLIHYFVDFGKMNMNRLTGWKADTCPQFWWLLGLDQALHQLTYLGLVVLALWLVL